jgi:hypothetical protein
MLPSCIIIILYSESGLGFFLVTENNCTCETLKLECNIIGAGSTVLKLQGNCYPSEITLLHSRYNFSSGTSGTTVCNNGAIELVGWSLRVEDNCFTSQLQISFNDNFAENLVSCIYDDGIAEMVVGNYLIHAIGKNSIMMYH